MSWKGYSKSWKEYQEGKHKEAYERLKEVLEQQDQLPDLPSVLDSIPVKSHRYKPVIDEKEYRAVLARFKLRGKP